MRGKQSTAEFDDETIGRLSLFECAKAVEHKNEAVGETDCFRTLNAERSYATCSVRH
jgi:hypothetical protein